MKPDLSPNPALPPLERALQASLLKVIAEFGGIARDLSLVLGPERLNEWSDLWAVAHEAAFSQIIEASLAHWRALVTWNSRSLDKG